MRATFDMPKLERSLKRFASDFGDTSAQAVIRWSVQVCRELAVDTQPFGKSVRKKQELAIVADAYRVLFTYPRALTSAQKRSERSLNSAQAVNSWMDANRGKNNRTRNLGKGDRKICSLATLRKAIRIRMKVAGAAKGGFLGAGQDIARAQTGGNRITIGKNFVSYAQKQTRFGDATKPQNGFNPVATLRNNASHSSKDYVLKRSRIDSAVGFGLKKTLTWYRAAIRAIDQK
jgi:hypothetical protein